MGAEITPPALNRQLLTLYNYLPQDTLQSGGDFFEFLRQDSGNFTRRSSENNIHRIAFYIRLQGILGLAHETTTESLRSELVDSFMQMYDGGKSDRGDTSLEELFKTETGIFSLETAEGIERMRYEEIRGWLEALKSERLEFLQQFVSDGQLERIKKIEDQLKVWRKEFKDLHPTAEELPE